MDQKSGWRLFSKRNVFGAILVAGIATGVYLGEFWKGFGFGNSLGLGTTDSKSSSTSKSSDSKKDSKEIDKKTVDAKSEANLDHVREVVEVVIVDRAYFVRSADGDKPAELKNVVEMAKRATGDKYDIRVRIYRKESSRASAEVDLKNALQAAGISEKQTFCEADPITD